MTFGWPRIHVPVLPSTMPVMATLATLGARHGTVLTCDFQTHGVGRQDRPWHAPAGSSLLMSVLVRTERPLPVLPMLSLLLAGAVAEAVEALGSHATIKWPNDVLVDGRKLSGILLRSHPAPGSTVVVAGIGLNLVRAAEFDVSATSLERLCGRQLSRESVLDVLLPAIGATVEAFEADDILPRLNALRDRLAFVNESVEILAADGAFVGTIIGLAESGALRLRLDDGPIRDVHSGEIVRGPRRFRASGA
jgi:BirA family biotin operon repressor/biotin-[acetyl-CoA-carboxylase] ligase